MTKTQTKTNTQTTIYIPTLEAQAQLDALIDFLEDDFFFDFPSLSEC